MTPPKYYIINSDGYFVHKIYGTCYVSWVLDAEQAMVFDKQIREWRSIITSITGLTVHSLLVEIPPLTKHENHVQ